MDTVQCEFNGNGQAAENDAPQCEHGGVIDGSGWCDKGFLHFPDKKIDAHNELLMKGDVSYECPTVDLHRD